jgi:AcrR family transcriptional regulator
MSNQTAIQTRRESYPAETSGRERIMDVAAASFLTHGYESTSLRRIADSVGMKAGSIYYHFASKDELLAEILRRGIDVMNEAFDQASSAPSADASALVAGHVRAHLGALYENGPYTAVHVTSFRTASKAVRSEIVVLRDAYEARWTSLLSSLQADGSLNPATDINLARLALFAVMNSSVEWFDQTRGNLDAFAAVITTQFWNGVAAGERS